MKYTINIEDNIPIPPKGSRYEIVHPLTYLLSKLEVGQSFIYPASTCEKFNGLRSIARLLGVRSKKTFATRKVKDNDGVEKLRIWRTA